ncbi:MAG: hypothetical protein ACD_71C00007G0005 [uncultured bacterium (gcode 4)]|uniref:Uncharacterized protein n=1 Tax=uncultured bacterium (gcode 4) TaxID=1234023 RepID=K1ZK31_9BACT|nr:MAG: hypothetical protein ACD_71C00007G0005 [uncultured bacterium (gcode 4)]
MTTLIQYTQLRTDSRLPAGWDYSGLVFNSTGGWVQYVFLPGGYHWSDLLWDDYLTYTRTCGGYWQILEILKSENGWPVSNNEVYIEKSDKNWMFFSPIKNQELLKASLEKTSNNNYSMFIEWYNWNIDLEILNWIQTMNRKTSLGSFEEIPMTTKWWFLFKSLWNLYSNGFVNSLAQMADTIDYIWERIN